MPEQPVDYAMPTEQERRRGVGMWITLLAVWIVGLAMWALYIAAIIYAFLRIFG
jgi:hypothetical protein